MNQRQQEIWHTQLYGDASHSDISNLSSPENRDSYVPEPVHRMGVSGSERVLSAIGTDFDQIRTRMLRTGKPVLDVGANCSTLGAEGFLNGIHMMATDLNFESRGDNILREIEKRIRIQQDIFTRGDHSISVDEKITSANTVEITPESWDYTVIHIMNLVRKNFAECKAHEITLPREDLTGPKMRASERNFSTVIAHHSVPQYCTHENFIQLLLPELLRVTDQTLLIYPLQYGNQALSIGSAETSDITDLAKSRGFRVSLEVFPTAKFSTSLRATFTRENSSHDI
jgi:hypothetical protein